jgi:hypothetical protein
MNGPACGLPFRGVGDWQAFGYAQGQLREEVSANHRTSKGA